MLTVEAQLSHGHEHGKTLILHAMLPGSHATIKCIDIHLQNVRGNIRQILNISGVARGSGGTRRRLLGAENRRKLY